MDLQKLIQHHCHEAEYWRRLHGNVAAAFHAEAAAKFEEIERWLQEKTNG
jgi:hypothetical protein